MPTIKEITAKYGKIHDELTTVFYPLKQAGLVDAELQAIFTASHLENELVKQAELKTASDYVEPVPRRDYGKEILELKARLDNITKVNGVA